MIVLEFKYLYRRVKGDVPADDYIVPIGSAEVRRPGSDLLVVTYGTTTGFALDAAEKLAALDGAEAAVLDLRSLMPWDKERVLEMVRKTGKVLVVHEDAVTGGIGAEIAATIADEAFRDLDAPVRRLGAADVPVPFAPTLEEAVLPDAGRILRAMQELARY